MFQVIQSFEYEIERQQTVTKKKLFPQPLYDTTEKKLLYFLQALNGKVQLNVHFKILIRKNWEFKKWIINNKGWFTP